MHYSTITRMVTRVEEMRNMYQANDFLSDVDISPVICISLAHARDVALTKFSLFHARLSGSKGSSINHLLWYL
jgi:hypothetical protein